MKKFIPLVTVASALMLIFCAKPQKQAVDEGQQWWKHVEYLASDDLKGRYTGSEGYRKAADYVAEQFQSLGLQPAGTNGYLQPAAFETRRLIPEKSSIEIIRNGRPEALKMKDEAVLFVSGVSSALVEAPLIFAGYGLTVPEANYDDFAGLKTEGAVAVILMGAPKSLPSLLAAHYRSAEVAARNAMKKGLRGVLVLANPRVLDLPWDRLVNSVLQTEMQPALPEFGDEWKLGTAGLVRAEAIDRILAGTRFSFQELSSLDKNGKPLPHFAMNSKIRVKAVFESGKAESPNVVAVLPGSDPKLKGEYVLLSAHLDHIGVGEPINQDDIYNGAMDNASGVATLLEAARLLRSSASRKRSILFLACTGEEEGLKGSLYYAEKPTVEAKNIVANINLDMYLPLFPLQILRAYGLQESDLANYLDAAAKENGLQVQDDPTPERNIFIRSDQYSFIKKGIPSLFLSFGYNPGTPEEKIISTWLEQRYHGPADDTKQPVDKMAAAKFNQLMATLAERLANAPQRPQWKVDSFFRRFVR